MRPAIGLASRRGITRPSGSWRSTSLVYYPVRERFGLSAQMAVRGIAKVVDAYALDKRTQRMFRTDGAFPYDARILSWDLESETVSLWTVVGRRRMPFECGDGQRKLLERQQGESDLIYHRQAV